MAIKAKATITLVKQLDVSSVTPYYLAQTSTLSPPTFSGSTISNWSTSQPELDLSKTCYIAWLTTLSDGTPDYSSVSVFAEYEAAKVAYNLADQANTTANSTEEALVETTQNLSDQINNLDIPSDISDLTDTNGRISAMLERVSGTGLINWNNGVLTISSVNATTGAKYSVVIGGDGIEFQYEETAAASINQDKLVINKTIVLDEMQVGNNKWTWKMNPDENDPFIFLKWIG